MKMLLVHVTSIRNEGNGIFGGQKKNALKNTMEIVFMALNNK